jgi:hypothetical protein
MQTHGGRLFVPVSKFVKADFAVSADDYRARIQERDARLAASEKAMTGENSHIAAPTMLPTRIADIRPAQLVRTQIAVKAGTNSAEASDHAIILGPRSPPTQYEVPAHEERSAT